MTAPSRFLLSTMAMALATCLMSWPGRAVADPAESADQVWIDGRIWTGDPAHASAEAMASRAGRFVAVGSRREVMAAAGPGASVVDLCGRRVVPGFNDAHAHYGLPPLNGFAEAGSVAEIERRLRAQSASLPAGSWLMDGGWAYADWPDRRPHRRYLDAAVPDRPVVLLGRDGHMLVANSAALALAGITAKSVELDAFPKIGQLADEAIGSPIAGVGVVSSWHAPDERAAAK